MAGNLVVARFSDGTTRKGLSLDVDPRRAVFHVIEGDTSTEVKLKDLKAIFFVKSLEGDSKHEEAKEPVEGDPRLIGTRLVRVRFRDGEEIVGLMNRYPPNTPFFFMLPVDAASNNLRILVNRSVVKDVAAL